MLLVYGDWDSLPGAFGGLVVAAPKLRAKVALEENGRGGGGGAPPPPLPCAMLRQCEASRRSALKCTNMFFLGHTRVVLIVDNKFL